MSSNFPVVESIYLNASLIIMLCNVRIIDVMMYVWACVYACLCVIEGVHVSVSVHVRMSMVNITILFT